MNSDRRWIAMLALAFALGIGASWQRWANPVIDSGREMNQPLRLADGEMLYSDVRHIYGPLSPYFHAALYRAFGPSVGVLYTDGIVCAMLILVLVYYLGRRVLDPAAAGTAALTVMWLCTFKPAGNYIFPYAYSALHGTLLALTALAIAADALSRPSLAGFVGGGIVAGAALLAKTEMGVPALCAGVTAAWLARPGGRRRSIAFALAFLAAAVAVAGGVYAYIAARVGWRTLAIDGLLVPLNMPAPLAYFNAALTGFDRPLASAGTVLIAAVKLAILAIVVGAAGYLAAGPADAKPRARRLLAGAIAAAVVLSVTTGLDWDRGPFLAMPVLLVALIVRLARGASPGLTGLPDPKTRPTERERIVLVYAVFALAQLGRMILHVRSGGAYGSFLLPMSVVVFTYVWMEPFATAIADPAARRVARAIVLWLLLASAIGTAVVLAVRYRRSNTLTVSTSRGTLIAPPPVGIAWNEALDFIESRTRPGDPIAVFPEGTSLTFLSRRRTPIREEIATPGFVDGEGEARAIAALERSDTRVILIVNRATREFGAESFGRDYNQRLMEWIASHYAVCAQFGARDPALEVGDKPFFVRAYCR